MCTHVVTLNTEHWTLEEGTMQLKDRDIIVIISEYDWNSVTDRRRWRRRWQLSLKIIYVYYCTTYKCSWLIYSKITIPSSSSPSSFNKIDDNVTCSYNKIDDNVWTRCKCTKSTTFAKKVLFFSKYHKWFVFNYNNE